MRYTRRRHRMTWPMHDAGSTTPDPGRGQPGSGPPGGPPGRPDAWPEEPWPQEPWRDDHGFRRTRWFTATGPGPSRRAGPAAADRGPDAGGRPDSGRDHAAAGAQLARPACPAASEPGLGPADCTLGARDARRLAPGAPAHRVRAAWPGPAPPVPAPRTAAARTAGAARTTGPGPDRTAVQPGPVQRRHGARDARLARHRVPAHLRLRGRARHRTRWPTTTTTPTRCPTSSTT